MQKMKYEASYKSYHVSSSLNQDCMIVLIRIPVFQGFVRQSDSAQNKIVWTGGVSELLELEDLANPAVGPPGVPLRADGRVQQRVLTQPRFDRTRLHQFKKRTESLHRLPPVSLQVRGHAAAVHRPDLGPHLLRVLSGHKKQWGGHLEHSWKQRVQKVDPPLVEVPTGQRRKSEGVPLQRDSEAETGKRGNQD